MSTVPIVGASRYGVEALLSTCSQFVDHAVKVIVTFSAEFPLSRREDKGSHRAEKAYSGVGR
jgi:hypothetical protein